MFKVHGFLNNERVLDRYIAHLPRNGDTVRLDEDRYVTVTEVIWCLDESRGHGEAMRINLRFEALKE